MSGPYGQNMPYNQQNIPYQPSKTERQKLDDGDTDVIAITLPHRLFFTSFDHSFNGFKKFMFDHNIPYELKRENFSIQERGFYYLTKFAIIAQEFDPNDPNQAELIEGSQELYGSVEYLRRPDLKLKVDVVRYIGRHHYHVDYATSNNYNVAKFTDVVVDKNTNRLERVPEMAFTNNSWLGAKDISFFILENGNRYLENIVSVTTLTSTNPVYNNPDCRNIPSVITIVKSADIQYMPESLLKQYLNHREKEIEKRILSVDLIDQSLELQELSWRNAQQVRYFKAKRRLPLALTNEHGHLEDPNQDEGEEWHDAINYTPVRAVSWLREVCYCDGLGHTLMIEN